MVEWCKVKVEWLMVSGMTRIELRKYVYIE